MTGRRREGGGRKGGVWRQRRRGGAVTRIGPRLRDRMMMGMENEGAEAIVMGSESLLRTRDTER